MSCAPITPWAQRPLTVPGTHTKASRILHGGHVWGQTLDTAGRALSSRGSRGAAGLDEDDEERDQHGVARHHEP